MKKRATGKKKIKMKKRKRDMDRTKKNLVRIREKKRIVVFSEVFCFLSIPLFNFL